MYKFINSSGEIVKSKSIKAWADKYGIKYSHAKTLACGLRSRHKGWCSTSPRAKKGRERFTTVLVNTKTGERKMLGQTTVKEFARAHHLCESELSKLLCKRQILYRGWALESTLKAARWVVADVNL